MGYSRKDTNRLQIGINATAFSKTNAINSHKTILRKKK